MRIYEISKPKQEEKKNLSFINKLLKCKNDEIAFRSKSNLPKRIDKLSVFSSELEKFQHKWFVSACKGKSQELMSNILTRNYIKSIIIDKLQKFPGFKIRLCDLKKICTTLNHDIKMKRAKNINLNKTPLYLIRYSKGSSDSSFL